ncbi:hypothetical protein QUG33_10455 [Citrobacter braakii]|uniref:hypothetical protein n=1 Tax=Citrobacter braakii TaxID=57706 RepID=UPI0025A2BD3F|nr:hypothetical protein [Citrobacter braakii]MDM6729864.1 hypothetical protein [Citrobacter braakii]
MTTNSTDLRNQLALEILDDETLDELIKFRRETTEYHISQGHKVQAIMHNSVLSALIELQERRKALGEHGWKGCRAAILNADKNQPVSDTNKPE